MQDVQDASLTKRNRCTDFTFLIVFIIFWIGFVRTIDVNMIYPIPFNIFSLTVIRRHLCLYRWESTSFDSRFRLIWQCVRSSKWSIWKFAILWLGYVQTTVSWRFYLLSVFSSISIPLIRYLFHLNQREPQNSVKICVRKCPRQYLENMAEIYLFYTKTNSSLCRYDFDFTNADVIRSNPVYQPIVERDRFDRYSMTNISTVNETGLCPVLPVYPT